MGQRVEALREDNHFETGVVLSVCDHGTFVRPDDPEVGVFGCPWGPKNVWVLADGPDTAAAPSDAARELFTDLVNENIAGPVLGAAGVSITAGRNGAGAAVNSPNPEPSLPYRLAFVLSVSDTCKRCIFGGY